ncbi:MAG: hypothetical protein LBV67_12390 [Streptococcaceae bacterium]|jgi:hypothetical protein|nr:hypothetical protein [Streptococcaceae bacterium]
MKLQKKLKIQFVSMLLVLVTFLSMFSPLITEIVRAEVVQPSSVSETTNSSIDDYFAKNPVNVPGMDSEQATDIVKNMAILSENAKEISEKEKANLIKEFEIILNNSLKLHVSTDVLDLNSTTALQISSETGEKDYYTLTVPIKNDNFNLFSNVTVVFDMNMNLRSYQESLIYKSATGNFEVETFSNGEQTTHKILEDKFVSNDDLKSELQKVQNQAKGLLQARGWGEKVACLVIVLGISRTIANILAPVCAASCVAVPLVCAACVTGFVALGGASISGVIGCFKL